MNLGIAGTGLSFRQPIGLRPSPRPAPPVTFTCKSAEVSVAEDGQLTFVDPETLEPHDDHWVLLFKKQNADAIKQLIADKVKAINSAIDALGLLHTHTPAPVAPTYDPTPFDLPKPTKPVEQQVGVMAGLIASKREAIARENADAIGRYKTALTQWQRLQQSHNLRELRKKQRAERGVLTELEAMEAQLEDNLADMTWPRETAVNFEVRSEGHLCVLDVDLPELEHMPAVEAAITGRGFQVKQKSAIRRRGLSETITCSALRSTALRGGR